jgi:hypothetical protein
MLKLRLSGKEGLEAKSKLMIYYSVIDTNILVSAMLNPKICSRTNYYGSTYRENHTGIK